MSGMVPDVMARSFVHGRIATPAESWIETPVHMLHFVNFLDLSRVQEFSVFVIISYLQIEDFLPAFEPVADFPIYFFIAQGTFFLSPNVTRTVVFIRNIQEPVHFFVESAESPYELFSGTVIQGKLVRYMSCMF